MFKAEKLQKKSLMKNYTKICELRVVKNPKLFEYPIHKY